MDVKDIPAFVKDVIETGCNITAVGDRSWLFGDADLPEAESFALQPQLEAINQRYGERTHLKAEIIAYLTSIGRVYRMKDDPDVPSDWRVRLEGRLGIEFIELLRKRDG